MKTKTSLKYQLVQKAVKRQIAFSTGYRQEVKSKAPLVTVPGVHMPECLETSMELNGSWNLTQMTTNKTNIKRPLRTCERKLPYPIVATQ
ncbi:hypothetical protein AQ505_16720 [Pedobacter sp. PACM 27299]|nr:hypothetical protein AQ505_16720 [Pedobacter sp. PACM 27299]